MGNNPAPSIGRWLIGLPNGGERKQTKRTDKRKKRKEQDRLEVRKREKKQA
jgi:hypothetical protein